MKIATLSSDPSMLESVKQILELKSGRDQFVYNEISGSSLGLERIDLVSTNVVIVVADEIRDDYLRAIAAQTRSSINPAFIYVSSTRADSRLLEMMQAGVSEVVWFPFEGEELRAAVERIRGKHYIATAAQPRGKIISFVSCKGGAGATFLATNLGYALSKTCDKKVLYIDLHLQNGDAVFYMAESAGPSSFADIVTQAGLDSTVVASGSIQIDKNFNLLQAPDRIDKSSGIKPQQIDNLLTVAVQDYDFVLVDLPETFDALSMKALDRSEFIYAVMQPMLPYIRSMTKLLHVFSLLGYADQKVKVVLNRSTKDLKPPLEKIEDAIQKKVEWTTPNDYAPCVDSVNAGIPILKLSPSSSISVSILQMAQRICGLQETAKAGSFLSKLFG